MMKNEKLIRDKNSGAILHKDSIALNEYKEKKRLFTDINTLKENNIILENKLTELQNKYDILEDLIKDLIEKVER